MIVRSIFYFYFSIIFHRQLFFPLYVYHIFIIFFQQLLLNFNYVSFTIVDYTLLSHVGPLFNL